MYFTYRSSIERRMDAEARLLASCSRYMSLCGGFYGLPI